MPLNLEQCFYLCILFIKLRPVVKKKSNQTPNDILAKLGALQERYAANLPRKMETITEQWLLACTSTEAQQHRAIMASECHTLAGSGTSFGYPEITRLARQIEELMTSIANQPLSQPMKDEIEGLLFKLSQAVPTPDIETPPQPPSSHEDS